MKRKLSRPVALTLLVLLSIYAFGDFLHSDFGVRTVKAAPIFSDGFETGDLSKWDVDYTTGSGVNSVETTNVYAGAYAFSSKVTDAEGWSDATLMFNEFAGSTVYLRAYLYIDQFNVTGAFANRGILSLVRFYNYRVASVIIDSTRHLGLWYYTNSSPINIVYSATTIPMGQWFCLEVGCKEGAGDGEITVYLNGAIVDDIHITGLTNNSDLINCAEPGIDSTMGVNFTLFIDDCVVDSSYIGPVPSAPLSISILSPENTTYAFADVPLTFTVNQTASWTGYSLDGQANVTVVGNTTMTGLADGSHQVTVYANNTVGDMSSSEVVYFTVQTTGQITFDQTGMGQDTSDTVVLIDGMDYNVTDLPVSFSWTIGSNHNFTFQSPLLVAANAKQYVWTGTSGLSTQQTDSITVSSYGGIVMANYKTQYYVTVDSPYDDPTPSSGWFDAGTNITESVNSPVSGTTGTRYVCTGWSGTGSVPPIGSDLNVTFTMSEASNISWSWKDQHLLTVLTDPNGLSPQPDRSPTGETGPSDGWWYDDSTNVTLTAQQVAENDFDSWDVDGISQGSEINPITVNMSDPHTATANYTLLPPLVHDVAVTKITSAKTIIGQGFSISMNITIENQGDTSEDFNVTIYANSTEIGKQSVSGLNANTTEILTFTWNTTSFGYGNYTITVSADVVANETDTADNSLSKQFVLTIPGDINGDGTVDIFDAIILAGVFNTNMHSGNWNANADLNGDGTVDIFDAIILAGNFGKEI